MRPANVEIGVTDNIRYIPSPLSNSQLNSPMKTTDPVQISDEAEAAHDHDEVQIIVPIGDLLHLSNMAADASRESPMLDLDSIKDILPQINALSPNRKQ